jgi:hypothetical protein
MGGLMLVFIQGEPDELHASIGSDRPGSSHPAETQRLWLWLWLMLKFINAYV